MGQRTISEKRTKGVRPKLKKFFGASLVARSMDFFKLRSDGLANDKQENALQKASLNSGEVASEIFGVF